MARKPENYDSIADVFYPQPIQSVDHPTVPGELMQQYETVGNTIVYKGTDIPITDHEMSALDRIYARANNLPDPAVPSSDYRQTIPGQDSSNVRFSTSSGDAGERPTQLQIAVTKTYSAEVSHPELLAAAGNAVYAEMLRDSAREQRSSDGRASRSQTQARRVRGTTSTDLGTLEATPWHPHTQEEPQGENTQPDADAGGLLTPERQAKARRASLRLAAGLVVLAATSFFAERGQTWIYSKAAGDSSHGVSYWSPKGRSDTEHIPLVGPFVSNFVPTLYGSGETPQGSK